MMTPGVGRPPPLSDATATPALCTKAEKVKNLHKGLFS